MAESDARGSYEAGPTGPQAEAPAQRAAPLQEPSSAGPAAAPKPGSGEPESPRVEAAEPESPGLLSDCRLMLSYARKNGYEIPADLLREISWVDAVLKTLNISPISSITSVLVTNLTAEQVSLGYLADPPDAAADELTVVRDPVDVPNEGAKSASPVGLRKARGLSPEEMVLTVHAKLSSLIAPTTALSLQSSEPPPGKHHFFGGMPSLVENAIVAALVSALFFIVSAALIGHRAAKEEGARQAEQRRLQAAASGASGAASSGMSSAASDAVKTSKASEERSNRPNAAAAASAQVASQAAAAASR